MIRRHKSPSNVDLRVVVFVLIVVLGFVLWLFTCTNATDARRSLKESGFSEVSIGDYAWFACGRDDWSATSFAATNPQGQRVRGTVCCGLLMKGCTIRW